MGTHLTYLDIVRERFTLLLIIYKVSEMERLVVEPYVDILQCHLLHIDGEFLLGTLLHLLMRFLRREVLDAVHQELVVGNGVTVALHQQRMDTLDARLIDLHLVAGECHQVHLHRQLLQFQHLPLLLVLYMQSVEVEFLSEDVDIDLIDGYLGTQLLGEHLGGIRHKIVLERAGIQGKDGTYRHYQDEDDQACQQFEEEGKDAHGCA